MNWFSPSTLRVPRSSTGKRIVGKSLPSNGTPEISEPGKNTLQAPVPQDLVQVCRLQPFLAFLEPHLRITQCTDFCYGVEEPASDNSLSSAIITINVSSI